MLLGTALSSSFRHIGAALGMVVWTGIVGGIGCDSKVADPVAPEPPVVTAPIADDSVRSPLSVTGTGVAGASVSVAITGGGLEIGAGEGVVDAQGAFAVELVFTDQALGTALQIEVVLTTAGGTSTPVVIDVVQRGLGNSFATAAEAPVYQGTTYGDMQIFDVANDVFLDEVALAEALDGDQVVYFGEQHETAPIHELQLWMLGQLTSRHDDVSLAMEHFQSDEQSVLDDYLDGTISDSQLLSLGDAWPNFVQYWKPLVDHMKALDRPVIATNIPAEALDSIYANGLTSPLAYVNTWGSTSSFDAYLPPRPLPAWETLYQDYFETGFDYASHGQSWGLTYQEALDYFTDLAMLRDHTMGYWIASHVEDTSNRILFVGGDWHVQTGIATPDVAATWSTSITSQSLITTTPRSSFESMRIAAFQSHPYADYILLYD